MRIKEVRKQKKMTQKDLADAIGVDYTVVSKYESGIVTPPISRLEAIAKTLNVPMDDLIGNDLAEKGNSDFKEIAEELNKAMVYIRKAEHKVLDGEYPDKTEVMNKLLRLENFIKDIRGDILFPTHEITKDTLIDFLIENKMISQYTGNGLRRAGCNTVGDITELTKTKLMTTRCFGRKCLAEIENILDANGLSFKQESDT